MRVQAFGAIGRPSGSWKIRLSLKHSGATSPRAAEMIQHQPPLSHQWCVAMNAPVPAGIM